jgi:hypothetical protein
MIVEILQKNTFTPQFAIKMTFVPFIFDYDTPPVKSKSSKK